MQSMMTAQNYQSIPHQHHLCNIVQQAQPACPGFSPTPKVESAPYQNGTDNNTKIQKGMGQGLRGSEKTAHIITFLSYNNFCACLTIPKNFPLITIETRKFML